MALSITEKVLGNNKFYTDTHIKETITLAKSIVIKNDKEARLYNDYLRQTVPGYTEESNPANWRYYRHISGERYPLDRTITAVSVDNGQEFVFDKAAMLVHRRTHEELLKFGLYYEELVKRYPELELYIKGVITTPRYSSVQQIIDLPDYQIVAYAGYLVEENEHDLISDLQLRIDSYQSTWLMGYYAVLDNLFLAAQYSILYKYIVTSILALRMEKDKTVNAHSFHIRLYLASHHFLDDVLLFLTKKQQLFLYRNMLYLNNHCGSNFTFQTLIDVLFTDRNISVVNYIYRQSNTTNTDGWMNYRYNQKLLNSKSLVVNTADMSLPMVAAKEIPLLEGNQQTYQFHEKEIDFRHRTALFSELLTKDLETILLDETDSVKYKLLQTLTDYWARLLQDNRVSFLVDIVDPASSMSVRVTIRDLFKLYLVVLYASNNIQLQKFPTYRVQRTFKETLPTSKELLKGCYDLDVTQRRYVQDLLEAVPRYEYYLTSYQFEQFVTKVYKLNIGLWTWQSNFSDMDTEGQVEWLIGQVHECTDFNVDTQESVQDFLDRTGLDDPRGYDAVQLKTYLYTILDNAYDKKLSFLSRYEKLQDALTKVFFKFNSYTVQLINNYYADAPLLVGAKDTLYSHTGAVEVDLTRATESALSSDIITEEFSSNHSSDTYNPNTDITHHSKLYAVVQLPDMADWEVEQRYELDQPLSLDHQVLVDSVSQSFEEVQADMLSHTDFSKPQNDAGASVIDVDLHTDFLVESCLVENVQATVPINVDFGTEVLTGVPNPSSEADLLFLAIHLK